MKGTLALSIADTFGSGDFPQPSRIIKITFLLMRYNFSPDGNGILFLLKKRYNEQREIAPKLKN